jgi:hypothetical protein
MQEEQIEEEQTEKKGFLGWLGSVFGGKKDETDKVPEPPHYKRRLLDGRIEKFLDQNLSSYISEYGILTGLDIESYEMRYDRLTARIVSIKDFMVSADTLITVMEQDIIHIQKAAKGGK